jgi:hypothetical protein
MKPARGDPLFSPNGRYRMRQIPGWTIFNLSIAVDWRRWLARRRRWDRITAVSCHTV